MFFKNKVLIIKSYQLRFWALSRNNQGTVYLFSVEKHEKKAVKKINSSQKTKSKLRIMFFRSAIAKRSILLMKLPFRQQKAAEITYFEEPRQERRYLVTYLDVST